MCCSLVAHHPNPFNSSAKNHVIVSSVNYISSDNLLPFSAWTTPHQNPRMSPRHQNIEDTWKAPVCSSEEKTRVVHVLVRLALLLNTELLEARLPRLWLLDRDVTGGGIVGRGWDLPLRTLRTWAPTCQPAARQRPRHGRWVQARQGLLLGNVGTTRHHVKNGGHNTGAKGARASTSEVELDRVGVGMLLAGYARDCQHWAVVLTWRCINPHPGILPNCPPPPSTAQPPTMVCHRGERGKNVRLDDTYVATPPTNEVLFWIINQKVKVHYVKFENICLTRSCATL